MGRRRCSVGVKPRSGLDGVLRRHIESIPKNSYVTVDELVNLLRSTYPHYSRKPEKPFANYVRRVLLQNSCRTNDDSNDDDSEHVSRRRDDGANNSSSSSLSSDEEASKSEDGIYGEKVEPEFDLMKSMLRESLRRKSKRKRGSEASEVVELEIVGNKDVKKVNLVNEESKLGGLAYKIKNDNGGSGGSKMKGPMFKDFGGMSGVIEKLEEELALVRRPEIPWYLGVKPIGGILLHGPPGCGKTRLARAIANETGLPFYKVSAPALVSGVAGASEENIRELFSKAYRTAPSIVFIDEIDAIASKRENLQRGMEQRIVTQLMTCMDDSDELGKPVDGNGNSEASDSPPGYVLVIGATNRPDALDPALRRPGRFDLEIELGVPDESARMEILSVLRHKLRLEGDFDLEKIARATPGFVGVDLAALGNTAGRLASKRIINQREVDLSKAWSYDEMKELKLSIRMTDFEEAAKIVQPSTTREGFSSIPNVTWDDVGGLHLLRHEFDNHIVKRIKFPKDYEEMGLKLETAGFLLYGPPGCGKTLIAKAVANEAGANFIHIKGPELLNKYVGESELAVRTIFSRARRCSPCILFFDEVDALTAGHGTEGGSVVERLMSQLLLELDGGEQRRGVYVIGATNRPEIMNPALLRPGRFGKLQYVPLPSPDDRGMILKTLARNKTVDPNFDLMAFGRDSACENLSGADLSALMIEAAMAALAEKWASPNGSCDGGKRLIKSEHFKTALGKRRRSVTEEQREHYKRLEETFSTM